jgi:hypothetical protein
MAGPIRSLDDLARKGFDLNVECQSCGYSRTIPIAEARLMIRARSWPEIWEGLWKRFRCSWCGARRRARLRAYPAADASALEVLRESAARANRETVATPAVRDALDRLAPLVSVERLDQFWQSAGSDVGPAAGRAASVRTALLAIEMQLGRHNDDAPRRIEWKYRPRYVWPMDIPALTDEELLDLFKRQPPTDPGTSPQADALADEIDRRGLDL